MTEEIDKQKAREYGKNFSKLKRELLILELSRRKNLTPESKRIIKDINTKNS